MLDDQPAQTMACIEIRQRPPMLPDHRADAGGSFAAGDAAELFGRDVSAVHASDPYLTDHHFNEMAFEQNSADDDGLKFNSRFKGLNKLPYPLDPELGGCVARLSALLQRTRAMKNASDSIMLLLHPPSPDMAGG